MIYKLSSSLINLVGQKNDEIIYTKIDLNSF